MAKLYYRYGAMGSSKTANALMVKYNYEERGQNVLLTKPAVDTRDGIHKIVSRCGLESECTLFEDIKVDYTIDELEEINLAYAVTIHKAQGSEFKIVIMPISSYYYPMLKILPIKSFESILTPIVQIMDKYISQRFNGDLDIKNTNVSLLMKGGNSENKIKGSRIWNIVF